MQPWQWFVVLFCVVIFAGLMRALITISRMKREFEIVYSLITTWAGRWGDPADEVKAALETILRQHLPHPPYDRRSTDDPRAIGTPHLV